MEEKVREAFLFQFLRVVQRKEERKNGTKANNNHPCDFDIAILLE